VVGVIDPGVNNVLKNLLGFEPMLLGYLSDPLRPEGPLSIYE
jgi:hypothetical protein